MRAALILVASLGACVETLPPLDETTSLRVELLSPTDLGAPDRRLDTVPTPKIRVTAIDARGEVDTDFNFATQVYVQFLGTLTPELGASPLATVMLRNGVSEPTDVPLPPVFGPAVIWVEDGGENASHATGTSPTLWIRDPWISDVQRANETALDALVTSPLMQKQIAVSGSQYRERGRLIVTSTYAQGYTVSDVQCADASGTPPCVAGPYDHLLIFTFSRPRDEDGDSIAVGQAIDGFAGGVQEFNGLTEIGFPQTFAAGSDVDPARVPAPAVIQSSWLGNPIEFERNEGGLVAVEGGVVCQLDDAYATYKQWKLNIGSGCGSSINVITAGVVDFDPSTRVGDTIPRVVGTLRPVNLPGFNVWIIHPRSSADLTLQ